MLTHFNILVVLFRETKTTQVSGSKSFYWKLLPVLELAVLLVELPPAGLQLLQHLVLRLHRGQPGQRFWE